MRFILLLLISVSAVASQLPQWIAVVPVYPDPALFDLQMTMTDCEIFGNMAGAVQVARRDTSDDLGAFLIRMPVELQRDNNGFPQPVISYFYSEIGVWVYTNYDQEAPVESVETDYTIACLRQGFPVDMKEWFELKKKEEAAKEKPALSA